MIYSKANLSVVGAASTDAKDGALHGVLFEADGSTIAGNGSALLAVGPVDYSERIVFPSRIGKKYDPPPEGLLINIRSVEKILKNLPKGKDLILQHSLLKKTDESIGMEISLDLSSLSLCFQSISE